MLSMWRRFVHWCKHRILFVIFFCKTKDFLRRNRSWGLVLKLMSVQNLSPQFFEAAVMWFTLGGHNLQKKLFVACNRFVWRHLSRVQLGNYQTWRQRQLRCGFYPGLFLDFVLPLFFFKKNRTSANLRWSASINCAVWMWESIWVDPRRKLTLIANWFSLGMWDATNVLAPILFRTMNNPLSALGC